MPTDTLLQQYQQLNQGAACVRIDSSVIRITGDDRHAFLHNFCTNEIKALAVDAACEAFVLNGKGKTIAHVHVLNTRDALILHAVGGIAARLIEHLDCYIIREDVQLADLSDQCQVTFAPGDSQLPRNSVDVDDQSGNIAANVEIAGFGNLLIGKTGGDSDTAEVSPAALEMIRIEQRTPWFGRDIDDSNLPQELVRDDQAISFNKGCYLGQETVARIDAMGKVNRVLCAVRLDQELPVGAELTVDEKAKGKLTSVAWSPQHDCWLGLAMVRRPHEVPGSILHGQRGKVTVVQ